jgi:predicted ABC-type ATPase
MNSENIKKTFYLIAGCNGAGKTTASFTILPEILNCKEFVNADEMAKGISPFNSSGVAVLAGKLMLKRMNELIEKGETFSIETTLASKLFAQTIKTAHEKGYTCVLLFLWIQDIQIAKDRVKQRVKLGGHSVEDSVIERRYKSGIINLFELYKPLVDELYVFDNTNGKLICNDSIYRQLEQYYEKIK